MGWREEEVVDTEVAVKQDVGDIEGQKTEEQNEMDELEARDTKVTG